LILAKERKEKGWELMDIASTPLRAACVKVLMGGSDQEPDIAWGGILRAGETWGNPGPNITYYDFTRIISRSIPQPT